MNMSQGEGDTRGPWNEGEQWEYVTDREEQMAVDGGDGDASVQLTSAEMTVLKKTATRTQSNPTSDPVTGAELGSGAASAMSDARPRTNGSRKRAEQPVAKNPRRKE